MRRVPEHPWEAATALGTKSDLLGPTETGPLLEETGWGGGGEMRMWEDRTRWQLKPGNVGRAKQGGNWAGGGQIGSGKEVSLAAEGH